MANGDAESRVGAVRGPVDAARRRVLSGRLRPLSQRILERLRGPHVLWIGVWALVPWLNAGANLLLETGARSAVWEQSRALVVLNYAALGFAVLITLWGTERIARRLEALRVPTLIVFEGDESRPFREMNSIAGPLLASAATAFVFGVSALIADGWTAGILRGATWLLVGIPLWTFLWTYASLQLGLDRLGRGRLLPDADRVDPTLGLRPLGDVAFMGYGSSWPGSCPLSSPASPTSSEWPSARSFSPAHLQPFSFRCGGCTARWST